MRICKNCNRKFKSVYKKNKLYSRGKNKGFSLRGIFCSKQCLNNGHFGKNNPTWNSVEKKCKHCRKKFFIAKSYIELGKGKYCSLKCYNKIRINRKIINCLHCGKEFIVSNYKININEGKYCSRGCASSDLTGELAPNYIDGRTPINKIIRKSRKYGSWRKEVLNRDNNECQICGVVGGRLNVNHIKKFSDYPLIRFDINNGITLCKKCHDGLVTHHEPEWESYFKFNLETRSLLCQLDV